MDAVLGYLDNKIDENTTVVVAVSGGPDSMALLSLLLKIKKDINIICAHVNHNTGRIGQKEEEEYVKSFCKLNNIKFELLIINEYSDDNFENEARSKRYNYFEELINKYNAKYLLTAHHGDDLIETILMRIVRGSTLKGYGGFNKEVIKSNYTILRPLIEVTKEDIINYLDENNIKYFIDSTNLEDIHTRNRYRKNILPLLKNEDKNVHSKFYKFNRMVNLYNDYIEKEALNIKNRIYINNKLNLIEFNKLDYVIKLNILYSILEEVYSDDLILITDNHINLINELSLNKENPSIHLPNNLKVIKKYNYLEFSVEEQKKEDFEIELSSNIVLSNGHRIEIIDYSDKDNNYICRLDKDEVKFPLYVRNRKDGDKMLVKNMNGTKKINDIFIDSKIEKENRNMWPIVLDSNDNIVWLPGLKKSKFDKTKDEKYDIILKYQ